MLLNEKLYLFNPYNLKTITDETISEQITELAKTYRKEIITPYDITYNIELASNLLYLYGEIIARYTERYQIKKIDNDKGEALETYNQRKKWVSENQEKAPNIDYFKALAIEKYQLSRNEEAKMYSDLIRWKKAYDSVESKMNAWKKQLEAMKYEIGSE